MKVAYDISILGMGYVNAKFRTGIYRMVESLFFELIKQQEIQIEVIAFNKQLSIWNDISIELYLQRLHPELEQHFQCCYHSKLKLHSLYKNAVELQRFLISLSIQNYPLVYKISRALQIPFNALASLDVKLNLPLHSWNIYHSPFFPLPNINTISNLPRILTVNDMIPTLFPEFSPTRVRRRFTATIKSINYQRDWITCISEHTKQDFCNYTGMDSERVFVTPIAAADFFRPISELDVINTTLKRYGIPNAPYLLSLCILEPRKNLSSLIRCFYQIISDEPSLELNLVLVGISGWKSKHIFHSAQQNSQLRARLIFTGHIPDSDLSAIYSGAIAFVYPSLYEGFGLPPLEAMQCGTPVITSNTSSLPEVVGDAGILVNPRQEDELCQAMLRVIGDSQLRAEMSKCSIQQARKFSWSKCSQETLRVYKVAASS